MIKDDRLYAFIVSQTSQSRSQIRRISIHPKSLKALAAVGVMIFCAALYGFYGLVQQARHLRIARENNRLREENENQRQQLNMLKERVEAVEGASRRLAEISGVEPASGTANTQQHGAGGPLLPLDAKSIASLNDTANRLERELRVYENALHEKARVPSIWPVAGEVTDAFGTRHDPFGGYASEFHAGQDIATSWGAPVVATGNGTISFAGTQNGYGQVVVIDHGNGLTTRYAHLSRIDVTMNENVARGQQVGRVGSTGRSTGPHLHYEVRAGDAPLNPRRYLP